MAVGPVILGNVIVSLSNYDIAQDDNTQYDNQIGF